MVTDEQSKIIAGASSNKDIYVELVYRAGNKKLVKYFLEKQKKIINEKYPDNIDKDMEEEIKKILIENETSYIDPIINIKDLNKQLEEQLNINNIETIEESIQENTDEETEEDAEVETEQSSEEVETQATDLEQEEYERIKREYGLS